MARFFTITFLVAPFQILSIKLPLLRIPVLSEITVNKKQGQKLMSGKKVCMGTSDTEKRQSGLPASGLRGAEAGEDCVWAGSRVARWGVEGRVLKGRPREAIFKWQEQRRAF